ncbi:MAG TPA: DinB family protein [Rhizomicrobium sp.]
MGPVANETLGVLIRQFDTAWKLMGLHLNGLSTDECLWRPAPKGLHVHRAVDGRWHADWPQSEAYAVGPPSIAWLTWHVGFWWSMVIDHSFGNGALSRQSVMWPGSAQEVRERLTELQTRWRADLEKFDDDELRSPQRARWPFRDRPIGDIVAWVNLELTKNAAEIGYARFLYAQALQ